MTGESEPERTEPGDERPEHPGQECGGDQVRDRGQMDPLAQRDRRRDHRCRAGGQRCPGHARPQHAGEEHDPVHPRHQCEHEGGGVQEDHGGCPRHERHDVVERRRVDTSGAVRRRDRGERQGRAEPGVTDRLQGTLMEQGIPALQRLTGGAEAHQDRDHCQCGRAGEHCDGARAQHQQRASGPGEGRGTARLLAPPGAPRGARPTQEQAEAQQESSGEHGRHRRGPQVPAHLEQPGRHGADAEDPGRDRGGRGGGGAQSHARDARQRRAGNIGQRECADCCPQEPQDVGHEHRSGLSSAMMQSAGVEPGLTAGVPAPCPGPGAGTPPAAPPRPGPGAARDTSCASPRP